MLKNIKTKLHLMSEDFAPIHEVVRFELKVRPRCKYVTNLFSSLETSVQTLVQTSVQTTSTQLILCSVQSATSDKCSSKLNVKVTVSCKYFGNLLPPICQHLSHTVEIVHILTKCQLTQCGGLSSMSK